MARHLTRRELCVAASAGLAAFHLVGCGEEDPPPPDGSLPGGSDASAPPGPDAGEPEAPDAGPASGADASEPVDASGQGCAAGGSSLDAGPADAIAVDSALFFRSDNLFVARDSRGIFALTAICTHQGCTVGFRPASADFRCPCHGSTFALDGTVTASPATRPLPHLACCIDAAGRVIVDKSRTVSADVRA